MQAMKKAMIVGAGIVTIGAGSLGVASAATADTSSSTSGDTSLVQKIATKFGLKTSDVQAVFDEDRAAHMAEMKEKRAAALKQAVSDGKLTQAQADYITKAWADMEASRSTDGTKPTDAEREAMKTKMDALKTWLDDQNIDLGSIDGLGGPGGPGHGGPRGEDGSGSSSSSSSASSKS